MRTHTKLFKHAYRRRPRCSAHPQNCWRYSTVLLHLLDLGAELARSPGGALPSAQNSGAQEPQSFPSLLSIPLEQWPGAQKRDQSGERVPGLESSRTRDSGRAWPGLAPPPQDYLAPRLVWSQPRPGQTLPPVLSLPLICIHPSLGHAFSPTLAPYWPWLEKVPPILTRPV